MKIHPTISDTDALEEAIHRLSRHDTLCVDTEFMREKTYYPELCLVQIASPDDAFIIDPLAENLDLSPLLSMMTDESILKIMHAGGQDIEIFVNLSGKVPFPLFDTQIAAMALGMGEQVSYANLVQHYTGRSLDKGARFTDWARRPLTERQLEYAISDVTFLSQFFPDMLKELKRTGRGTWLDEEMERLSDPTNYITDPDAMWQRLKLPNRKPEVLGRLKALAAWRELEARDKNIPRGRLLKDETLADLAAAPPRTQADLAAVRGLASSWGQNNIGARLMQTLADAAPLPAELIPQRERRPNLSSNAALVADLLKLVLKIRCKEEKIAPRLVARSDELEALAGGQREGLPILTGWRRQLFGEDALAIIEGRLGFHVEDGKLRMQETGGEAPVSQNSDS